MPKTLDLDDQLLQKYGDTLQCMNAKCKKENAAFNKRQAQYTNDMAKILHNVALKPDVREKRLKKLMQDFNKSVQKRKEIDCKLKNCYQQNEDLIRLKVQKLLQNSKSAEWSKKIADIYDNALKKGKITHNDIITANNVLLTHQIEVALNNAKPLMDNLADTENCTKKHCSALKKQFEAQKKKFLEELNKIHRDTKLNEKEKLAKLEQVSINHFDSPVRNKLLDCELGQCREETEKIIRQTINMVKTIPNPSKMLSLSVKLLDDMLKTKTLTKDNMIKADLKFMKELGYKMSI